jgi:hypothetical protein
MLFESKQEQQIVNNFLLRNNLFIHNLVSQDKIIAFLKKINVYQTELIRLGSNNDGGYLVPNDLKGISACFSPGVDTKIQFEKDLTKKDIPSYLLDYSIDCLPEKNELFTFEKKYLGVNNDNMTINFNTWINKYFKKESNDEFILQMDIEGSEYEVLLNLENSLLKKFRIMIIEFHSLNNLLHPGGYRQINALFDKILEHFYIVHIHPNNIFPQVNAMDISIPTLLEFSFIRKDRLDKKINIRSLPNDLDQKNILDKRDIVLPGYWYK